MEIVPNGFDSELLNLEYGHVWWRNPYEPSTSLDTDLYIRNTLSHFAAFHRNTLASHLKGINALQKEKEQFRQRKAKGYKFFLSQWTSRTFQLSAPNAYEIRAWGALGEQFNRDFKLDDREDWDEIVWRLRVRRLRDELGRGPVQRWDVDRL